MNITYEDIESFLPRYLNTTSSEKLFEDLKQFSSLNYSNFYLSNNSYKHLSSEPTDELFQGDILSNMPFVTFPKSNYYAEGMLISNTCDMSMENSPMVPANICYALIIKFEKLRQLLIKKGINDTKISEYLERIKSQKVSQYFYIPGKADFEESIVLLDKVCNCSKNFINREDLEHRRLLILTNASFYLFIFKLSVHLTRIREGVEREKFDQNLH